MLLTARRRRLPNAPLLAHVTVWGIAVALYYPLFYQLYRSRWEILDYTHAYFILPISLLLAWFKRVKFSNLTNESDAHSQPLVILVSGLFLFFIGWQFEYVFLQTLSAIPVLFGLIGYLYGKKCAELLRFPIFYLLFLVPPPLGVLDSITLPMRFWVSIITERVLLALHYPITREGLLLAVGGNEVYLGEACSGLRSLVTLGALGSAYAYTTKLSLPKKWVLGLSVIPLALTGNIIRVISVCLVTYYLGVSKGQKYYHDISGFLIFLFLLVGLLSLESLLRGYVTKAGVK